MGSAYRPLQATKCFSPARRYGISCGGGARVGGDGFDGVFRPTIVSVHL